MTEISEPDADVRKPCPDPDKGIGTEDEPSKASHFVGDTENASEAVRDQDKTNAGHDFEKPDSQTTPEPGGNDPIVDEEISAYLPTTQVQQSPSVSALDARNSSFNQYQKFFDTSATEQGLADESVTNGDDALQVFSVSKEFSWYIYYFVGSLTKCKLNTPC